MGKLFKMTNYVLKNNYFEFSDVHQKISGTTIRTKFAPPYACIFMAQVESKFQRNFQLLVYSRCIDDIFFIWTHDGNSLK